MKRFGSLRICDPAPVSRFESPSENAIVDDCVPIFRDGLVKNQCRVLRAPFPIIERDVEAFCEN